jgi:probable rRNA maturation factor
MVEFYNKTDRPVKMEPLAKVVERLTDRPVEVVIVNNAEIAELNRQFRGKEGATDVLSFPLDPIGGVLGSVVISIEKAEEGAKKYGHSVEEELKLLLIHGILHLLGYDHETDNGEMRERERAIIEELGLPKSLIVREEERSE